MRSSNPSENQLSTMQTSHQIAYITQPLAISAVGCLPFSVNIELGHWTRVTGQLLRKGLESQDSLTTCRRTVGARSAIRFAGRRTEHLRNSMRPQQQRKQQQQQQQDRIPTVDSDESRERLCTLQRAAHAADQISVQVGEYQPGHPSEYRGSSSTTQAEAGSNGCNRSRSRGPIGTSPFPMSSRRSSLSQVEAMAQTESNHFSEKTRMCEHVKNALGHESQGQARADKRASYFTWNINPSLTEGQELMGFGGDLGKKRFTSLRRSRKPMVCRER
jgi:hypothetical protein